jgi:hypothetical protein
MGLLNIHLKKRRLMSIWAIYLKIKCKHIIINNLFAAKKT